MAFPELAPLLAAAQKNITHSKAAAAKYHLEDRAFQHNAAAIEAILALTPSTALESQRLKQTSTLSHAMRSLHLANVLEGTADYKHPWLLSGAAEGAAFIDAPTTPSTALSSDELVAWARLRVGLLPTPNYPAQGQCDRCALHHDHTGRHALACRGKNPGRGIAARHSEVKNALSAALSRIATSSAGSRAMAPLKGEPKMGAYFRRNPLFKPAANQQDKDEIERSGDIICRNTPRGNAVFDVTIRLPFTPQGAARTQDFKPGKAADDAYDEKIKHYAAEYLPQGGIIIPIAIEAGGRWAPRSRDHITDFIKWCINKPDDKYTADDKVFYTNSLRDVLDSTALALVRHQARQLVAVTGGVPWPAPAARANSEKGTGAQV